MARQDPSPGARPPTVHAVLNLFAPPTGAPQTLRLTATLLAEVSTPSWPRPVGQRPHTEHLTARRLEEGRVVVTRQVDEEGETVDETSWVFDTAEDLGDGLGTGPLARALYHLRDLDALCCRNDGGPVSICAGAIDCAVWSGRTHVQPRTRLIQESGEVQAALEASGHRLCRGVAPGDLGDTWAVRDQTRQPGPRGSAGT